MRESRWNSGRELVQRKRRAETSKTNAAWASHPSRIVVADVLTAVFRRGERSSRNCTRKSAMHRCSPEACASGLRFSASILLEEGFLRRPQSPGTGTLDMRRISPGDSLSRKSPATLNPCRNRFRTSHAFDCKHFAAAEKLTQRQTAAPLCKNCGAAKLPVERKGKVYFYSVGTRREKLAGCAWHDWRRGRAAPVPTRARVLTARLSLRGLPYNTPDDCASSRNAAGETSEPGDRGNARGRL